MPPHMGRPGDPLSALDRVQKDPLGTSAPSRPATGVDPTLFRVLLDDATDPVFVLDADGVVLDANAAALEAAGTGRVAVVGAPFTALFSGADAALDRSWADAASGSCRVNDADGVRTWSFRFRGVEAAGRTYIVANGRDITARLAEEEERIRHGEDLMRIIKMLPDVIFICEKRADGKIYWTLNEGKLAEEFGLTTKEIEGKSLEELFPGGASEYIRTEFENAFKGIAKEFVNEMGGRYFKHFPQPITGDDGKVKYVVGFISEVTSLVEAEKKIQALNDELTDRLDEVAAANRDLEAFTYTVSHDLRSPLAALDSIAQVVNEADGPRLDEAGRKRIGRMRATIATMGRQIEDILRLSRAGRTPPEREETDLAPLAQDTFEMLKASRPERVVAFEVPESLPAYADPGQMRVVLDNLVGNAWKFTEGTEDARIELGVEETDEGPTYYVRDNGAGFDPAHADALFDPFTRLHEDSEFKGSGIGLATVRKIVARHGGKVWAEGAPGKGATIRWTLPRPDEADDGDPVTEDAA